ncbi:M14 family metallopeptidase [Stygiobacter electus]|uniref:M14 family metallopeptidase n=1 Tax=Stygiobacter electus TaxID=3032292 RepID=A0AAE3NXP7_9BACT|nr:M14 family metallopeptidase [Stygiobacter electus]MDF1610694.1 M14 family metallopeptidase [Stygiobacter electus]
MKKFIMIFLISLSLIAQQKNNEWVTYFEKSNYLSTPNYDETIKYFKALERNSPYIKLIPFGKTAQERTLYICVVSKEKAFTPAKAKKINKPIILIQNGIHSGEIEGKDASMILLREILITKEKFNLIDNVTLLIIPVFNADGHERRSPFNRINQNGPTEMGWRTTAQNYNLNRDYMKADSPEIQSWLKLFNQWLPDFFVDSHTTDGADYQYTITYGIEKYRNLPPKTAQFVKEKFIPFNNKRTEDKGFLIAPYVSYKGRNFESGIVDYSATPRFSTGYTAVQNRIGLLIETHMLKPYKDRVFATKAMFENVIEFCSQYKNELIKLNQEGDRFVVENYFINNNYFPLSFDVSEKSKPFLYKGIEAKEEDSWITGKKVIRYTGKPFEKIIPFYDDNFVKDSVKVPIGYIIPVEYKEIVNRIKLHGIEVKRLNEEKNFIVEKYMFNNVKFSTSSFENHFQPTYDYEIFRDTIKSKKGDYFIRTNQRTLGVIVHLLEPKGPDSFLRWGFFNSIFEPKEYFEEYSMEPIAQKMVVDNPKLKEEFENYVNSDPKIKENPRRRLNFFYERSPYFDNQLNIYPILRVIKTL